MTRYSLLVTAFLSPLLAFAQVEPLPQAHSHNDYEQQRPLFDALDHGFCSVEADIWLIDGKLLVAHNRKEASPDKTLQSLYLEPLVNRLQLNSGAVFPDGPGFTLLIDIKSDAQETYALLREQLKEYSDMLTRFSSEGRTQGAITIVISGNRPARMMAAEKIRYAGMDGRLSDLDGKIDSRLIPMVSDHWSKVFGRQKTPPFSAKTMARARKYIGEVHASGANFRLWAVPHSEKVWQVLVDLGVDHINTDELARLQAFLALK